MKWISVNESLPSHSIDVLIADTYDNTFTVAWYSKSRNKWFVASDFLVAENYDGSCAIELNPHCKVKFWAEIPAINMDERSLSRE